MYNAQFAMIGFAAFFFIKYATPLGPCAWQFYRISPQGDSKTFGFAVIAHC